MGSKIRRLSYIVSVLAVASGAHMARAAGPYVIGGPASSLATDSGPWAWDSSHLSNYRTALGNTAFFGTTGIITRPISTTTLSSITAGTLSGVNLFIAPYWSDANSAPYVSLVVNYFQNGGSLLLLDDGSSYDAIAEALGIPTIQDSTSNVTNGGPPLYSGPFGTVTNVMQGGDYGTLSGSAITSHGGTVCGANSSSQPVAACFARGAYSSGSGAMIITTDVDMFSDAYTAATFSPLNANGSFDLNATAFLVNAAAPTTSVPTLPDTAVLALAMLLIATGIFFVGRRKPVAAA